VFAPSSAGVCGWELLLWRRLRAWDALSAATAALVSTAELLAKAPHMPFPRGQAARAGRALALLREAQAHLQSKGGSMSVSAGVSAPSSAAATAAASALLRASSAARAALFDAGMVPLLYFPDEHAYAVYAPLFAPIIVPVLAALFKLAKAAVAKRKAVKQA